MTDSRSQEDDVWEGFRLTGVAVLSAFVTAALIIGIGGAILPTVLAEPEVSSLVRVSDRH